MAETTMKQEIFCQAWVDSVGNGTHASLMAFDIEGKEMLELAEKYRTEEQKLIANKAYSTASTMATEYLRKPEVRKRIDEILDERGFNDETVKKVHFQLLQSAKSEVRMKAVESYYMLMGKIIEKKDVTVTMPKPIMELKDVLTNDSNEKNSEPDQED